METELIIKTVKETSNKSGRFQELIMADEKRESHQQGGRIIFDILSKPAGKEKGMKWVVSGLQILRALLIVSVIVFAVCMLLVSALIYL